jgi:hypothetical protein
MVSAGGGARHGQALPRGRCFSRCRRSVISASDSLTSNGVLTALGQNGVDGQIYAKNSSGIPPASPQVTTAKGNLTITTTDNAKPTNFGGVYGHTIILSEPGSNDLGTITAADPTGLLVATPVEGNPNPLSVREYREYREYRGLLEAGTATGYRTGVVSLPLAMPKTGQHSAICLRMEKFL